MPIYEYVCTACGREFEVVHGIHSPRPVTCQVCGGVLRKAMSTPSIVFKGSGWAKKDARSAAAGGGAKPAPATTGAEAGDPGSASAGTGEASTSSDAAPAAPTTSSGSEGSSGPTPAAAAGSGPESSSGPAA